MKERSKALVLLICLACATTVFVPTPSSALNASTVEFLGRMYSELPVRSSIVDGLGGGKELLFDIWAPHRFDTDDDIGLCRITSSTSSTQPAVTCSLNMWGTWHEIGQVPPRYAPWCEASGAYGEGVIEAPGIGRLEFEFTWIHHLTTVEMTGVATNANGESGPITAIFEITPDAFTGEGLTCATSSVFNNPVDKFIVSGAMFHVGF